MRERKGTLIKVDRNGTKYYVGMIPCERCGGAGGADKWEFTGWKCYKCGGSGQQQGSWKVYTPEYEAKLEARREARRKKWEEEHAEEIAQREAERKAREEEQRTAEEERKRLEAEELARKAKSQYIGQIGDKVEIKAKIEKSAWFEYKSPFSYGMATMYVYTFRDADGNAIVWKTSKGTTFPEDTELVIKGTVKDHSEYRDEKQTVLTRCKVTTTGATE